MASKADLLKKSVNKTGKGLFAGMTPIKEENEKKTSIENNVEASVNSNNNVKEIEAEIDKEAITLSEKTEEPTVQKANLEKIKEEKKPEPTPTEMVEEILRQNSATKEKRTVAADKQEKTSRYEKEKFLLLDIRGYRDYVEHMAKAANMSATKYIRSLIEQDMSENMDIYEAHKALEERLKKRK
ncbi:hypothetical protein D6853_14635 [Butyrivibrio sp. X503]|uniref:hypothetical protein n=1 Tax=Butyrivibrio sp. X503 TaxID=2364878 RepID=UPI000EA873F4|nr:hypothetical protein [Butyrivibrio sp. X503]RKM53983.1 hypothetical protein D6853_14635 [Butyrivibrio sp. X503]